jgi:hypothetical protein
VASSQRSTPNRARSSGTFGRCQTLVLSVRIPGRRQMILTPKRRRPISTAGPISGRRRPSTPILVSSTSAPASPAAGHRCRGQPPRR